MMKALENAQAIYDITMNEKCEAKVQDLFSNGLHKLMVDLIEELEELQNRSCENCKKGFDCPIFRKLWKEKLRKEGYLMSRKEFDCRFWESK